ncbi:MAG: hypothetical protein CMQ20_02435 [Gammaproteobacteria bacterium]|jgi:hypothetical protein|nr:hypothetical protein [Gammaproteobacteria bacterium]|tara:strand:- start:4605 stop:5918 length:1314 start_codon:yes stop_codon:yes gene_type:complete
MKDAALSLEQTPPLAVPLIFMLTAPFFAVLASLIAITHPEALSNRWDPAMIAMTHLLTLGFITMVMVGALQQLLPVLAGVQLSNPLRLSRVIYFGLATGTLVLCAGFLLMLPVLIGAGASLLGVSFLWLIARLLLAIVQSEASTQVTRGMKLALFSFLVTLLLGLYLAAGYTLPQVSMQRTLTSLHIGWGLFGWVGILVFTISYQVVPMFQVTPKYPDLMIRWLAVAIFSSLVLISFTRVTAPLPGGTGDLLVLAFESVMAAGFALYALMTIRLQQQRRRRVADVTMDYWRFGLTCLLLALVTIALADGAKVSFPGIDLMIGTLMIVGFTMSLITGMLYKIIPFLVWLHLTNTIDISTRWQQKIPNMKKIVPDRHARFQFRLHLVAVGLILTSLQFKEIVEVAAIAFMLSNLYLAFNLVRGAAVYRRVVSQASHTTQ